jgi:hypothetical protein
MWISEYGFQNAYCVDNQWIRVVEYEFSAVSHLN